MGCCNQCFCKDQIDLQNYMETNQSACGISIGANRSNFGKGLGQKLELDNFTKLSVKQWPGGVSEEPKYFPRANYARNRVECNRDVGPMTRKPGSTGKTRTFGNANHERWAMTVLSTLIGNWDSLPNCYGDFHFQSVFMLKSLMIWKW